MNKCNKFLIILSLTFFQGYAQEQNALNGRTFWKFDLGSENVSPGYLAVSTADSYSDERGYGFDFSSKPRLVSRKGKDPLRSDFVTSDRPFYFSVRVPEGNYKVTLTLGDSKLPTRTTVKAESRRLMLENVEAKAGQHIRKSFIVNIKDRKISPDREVGLKPRETTKLDWDNKLSLEFDSKTALNAIEIEKADDQITVYLAGNSTVVNQEEEPWASWGQMIPRFFKPGLAIANHAESGLSLGSFIASRRLEKILTVIKPGDYVFVEFGHNDEKEKGPDDGPYKSYTERLKLFSKEIRAMKGNLVILTPTARRSFDATGMMVNSHGEYPDAARKVAAEEGVPLIDLTALTTRMYEALGPEGSKSAFVIYPEQNLNDNTHFNPYGAYQIAKMVAQEIRGQNLPIAKYLVDMPAFNSAFPDPASSFKWPPSPKVSAVKPDGN
ncbi:rhamnogalacturonan acetylesterase [Arcticibacter sp.]|uniref:rhamnogalacturonan acetylesterase n=1 Tax=Arcticibacter sp. TaxID=1872630 RepID=UPI00388D6469